VDFRALQFCQEDVGSPALVDQFLAVAPHWDILCDGCMQGAFVNGVPECPGIGDVKLPALRMSLIEARIILSESGVGSMLG
jgi:hypothetical protein